MLTKTKGNITPFGGLHIVHRQVLAQELPTFIDRGLKTRHSNAHYRYCDLILNRFYTVLCGGDCAQDIGYTHKTLQGLKDLRVSSPDTILRMERELSTPVEGLTSDGGSHNRININTTLNELLIGLSVKLGLLDSSHSDLCLDFDHQFIRCEKDDASYSYKKEKGYFPGVASIDNIPVHVENRNGNCHVNFKQLDTFERMFSQLKQNGITPAYCRMDSGSYIKELCDYLEKQHVTFYIRAEQSDTLLFNASMCESWNKCEIGYRNYEVSSIEHSFGKHDHRIVCYRWPNTTGQTRIITGDANSYLFIITNDRTKSEKQIIEFYNARGNAERLFDILNNDFNWNSLPCSRMEYNTVYMIIMAMCLVMYRWSITALSRICPGLEPYYRLKKFTFRLICIAAKTVRTARRQVVKLFTDLPIDLKSLSP